MVWLYGDKKEDIPPKIESQNPDLRRLNDALMNRESLAALRRGAELEKAYEISLPPDHVFEQALIAAKRELTQASAYLTNGYDKSEALLKIAGSVANMAEAIYDEMERKRTSGKKTRVTE